MRHLRKLFEGLVGKTSREPDSTAIWNLMIRYASAVDRGDFQAVEDCFSPGAQCTYNGERLPVGRSGVSQYLRGRLAAIAERANPTFAIHFVGNVDVDVNGDTARARTYAVRYVGASTEDGIVVETRGLQYDDELIRVSGRWLINERVLVGLWETTMA